jgi:hypothetical protein
LSISAPRAVLALAAVLLVAGTAFTLHRNASRIVGTNGVVPATFALSVPVGERACQRVLGVPARARAVRLTVGVYGRPGARIRAEFSGRARGPAIAARDGVVEMPLPRGGTGATTKFCVVNVGAGRVALAGALVPPSSGAVVGRRQVHGVFALAYLDARPQRWADRVGAIVARVGYANGVPGGALTGPILIALLIAALGGALAACWRQLRA